MNILIVDDEKLIRQGLSFLIMQMGTRDAVIAQCKNGREALELCLREELTVDVVITDVRMPEMDGLELIAALKIQRPHIQTLVMSGYDEFDYVRRALREGAQDYLLKPVDKSEVKAVLDRIQLQKTTSLPTTLPVHTQTVVQDSLLNSVIAKEPGKMQDAKRYFMGKFGASDEEHAFIMAGVLIDETPEHALKNTDRQLFQYFMRKMSEELLFADAPQSGMVFQGGDGTVYILFFLDKNGREYTAVGQRMRDLFTLIQQHIRYPVTVGMSTVHDHLSDLADMSSQLDEVFRARLTMGTGQILGYDQLQQFQSDKPMPKDLMKPVILAVETADEEALLKAIVDFFSRLRAMDVKPELTMDIIMRMLMRLVAALQERGINTIEAGLTDGLTMSRQIEKCSTWELLVSYVTETLIGYLQLLQRYTMEAKPAYIMHAIEYIRIHYASDITLNEVADTVGLYPTYLSEQFKLHTSGTFIDFITQVRVERAKDLLRKSALPAFTICEEVGYATPAHFSKVFKKWVGCTPTEYRERYQHQLML